MSVSPASTALLLSTGAMEPLSGGGFPDLSDDHKRALSGKRPTAKRIGGVIVCAARVSDSQVLLHAHNDVPEHATLTDLVRSVQTSAKAHAEPVDASARNAAALTKAATLAAAMPIKKRSQIFLEEVSDAGFEGLVAIAEVRGGKVGRLAFANPKHVNAKNDLLALLTSKLRGDELGPSDQVGSTFVAKKLGGATLSIIGPLEPERGVTLVGVDLLPADEKLLQDHNAYLNLLQPFSASGTFGKSRAWQIGKLAAAAAFAVYLGWPAPIYVENIAQSRASASVMTALPFPVFLDKALARPGQKLKAGELAVSLRSPDTERAIAQEKLTQKLEAINAQDALGEGDYSKVQLAEKRQEIARLREDQFRERLDLLSVTAPVDGIVTSIQSSGTTGSYLAPGTPILEIQPQAKFDIDIEIAPIDAARVKPGQTGVVYFRGLSSEIYTFELKTGAIQVLNPDTKQTRLQARASLTTTDQSRLLVGLEGYAKVETGSYPRIYGWARPALEHVRLSAWKYLGLSF